MQKTIITNFSQKKCEFCGKLFSFIRKTKRFCSSNCQKNNWVVNNKTRNKKNRDAWYKRTNKTMTYYNNKNKEDVFNHYGNKCADCGESDSIVLSIDHLNGGGKKHRDGLGGSGDVFYRWLKNNDYPEGFELVCRNCNWRRWINRKNG